MDKNSKLKIVLVDDEPIIRMDLRVMLERAGYLVVGEGMDGFDAISLCKEHKPDVIILDVKMEALDGLSAARVISDECPSTAIIVLTGFNKGEYIDKAKECRISSYIVKPINEKLLVPNIELAVVRNRELYQYREEIEKVTEKLESRKIIEKAKGLLMNNENFSEEESFNYIRQISKDRNIAMLKVAKLIIKKYEIM